MRWLNGVTDTMGVGLCGLRELVMDREACRAVVHRVEEGWARLSKRTELRWGPHGITNVHKDRRRIGVRIMCLRITSSAVIIFEDDRGL